MKDFMKKLNEGLKKGGKKLGSIIKYLWTNFSGIIIAVGAILIGIIFVKKSDFFEGIFVRDKVTNSSKFMKIPGDDKHIMVKTEEGKWKIGDLPEGLKSKDVDAAGYGEGGNLEVTKKHTAVNRRDIDDNPVDGDAASNWPGD